MNIYSSSSSRLRRYSFVFRTQGSCTAYIRPEYLLPPELYDVFVQMRESTLSASTTNEQQKELDFTHERTKPLHLSHEVFEAVSKKTWVDVLMQILKVILHFPSIESYRLFPEFGPRSRHTEIL